MNVFAIINAVDADEQLLLVLNTGTPDRPSSETDKKILVDTTIMKHYIRLPKDNAKLL